MNITPENSTLVVSSFRELTAGNAADVKADVRLRFLPSLKDIDIDCSGLEFLDSSGLGTLVSIQKLASERGGKMRLLKPGPTVMQVLELTRLHRVFEIVA